MIEADVNLPPATSQRAATPPGIATAIIVSAIAAVAAVVAALGPAAPTGSRAVDVVLIGAGVLALVLVAEGAPWWSPAIAAGVAAAIALDPVLMVVAAAGLAAALRAGSSRRSHPELLAVSMGITCNVLCRAELHVRLGLSAAISLAALALVFVTGIRRRSKRVRRIAWFGLAALVLVAGASSAAFGYAAYQSRHELGAGQSTAELGVVALQEGKFGEAADWFRQSAALLDSAHARMTKPWMLPAAAVPVVAQHRSAVVDMSAAGADGAHTVADALAEIDLDSLRATDGRIDLDALSRLIEPLEHVQQALVRLQTTTDSARSVWLVRRATYQLDDFAESIAEHLPSLNRALDAIRVAPQMLGADGARDYLLLFTTPSESRGGGGMPGTYAELHVEDGKLTLGETGRVEDLDRAAEAAGAVVHGNEAFLTQYGQFGYDTDDGHVGDAAFRNLTMTPDFPTVGAVAADLYEQTTGHHVDGVIAIDPTVLGALLRYTGPIQLATLPETLTADNATEFLLRGQYVAAADVDLRVDSLAEVATQTFQKLMSGALPDPMELARDMGPLVGERRLTMWSANPDEQALMEQVGLAGAMPSLDGANGWAVTVTNAGGSKIDSYLERAAGFEATTDPATGTTTATLRVQLSNTAPAEGLPRYIIGNRFGLPLGTSRLYVSFYSPLALTSVTVGGVPTAVSIGAEHGWNVYSLYVDIPSGEARSFEVHLSGTLDRPDDVVTWTQPLANPLQPL
ncbi:MAG: DUF4012 domain-containing protein [Ilumatobacteraceae bacterium]